MIHLKKIKGPFGIPIYHQRMPEIVKSVGMTWVMFTGAADDESVGKPGLYHWFEHIPFRGTKKYPNGYQDTKGRLTKYGGSLGGGTGMQATRYEAVVPLKIWKEGLSVVTDIFSQPLIRDVDVAAERSIIHQEIVGKLGSSREQSEYQLNGILHPGHPFGHPILGDHAGLNNMDASTLRKAYKSGYDHSRSALFVCGNISQNELLDEVDKLKLTLPDNGLSERRSFQSFGTVPWTKEKLTVWKTSFSSSMVYLLFPLKGESMEEDFYDARLFTSLFGFGVASSPLYRVLREERALVYRTNMISKFFCGGGFVGFVAEADLSNVDRIMQAFRDLTHDPIVKSKERLKVIQSGIANAIEMQSIHSGSFCENAVNRYLSAGKLINDSDLIGKILRTNSDDVERIMGIIDEEKARVIIFEGRPS